MGGEQAANVLVHVKKKYNKTLLKKIDHRSKLKT